jgi:hypothetical protein
VPRFAATCFYVYNTYTYLTDQFEIKITSSYFEKAGSKVVGPNLSGKYFRDINGMIGFKLMEIKTIQIQGNQFTF